MLQRTILRENEENEENGGHFGWSKSIQCSTSQSIKSKISNQTNLHLDIIIKLFYL